MICFGPKTYVGPMFCSRWVTCSDHLKGIMDLVKSSPNQPESGLPVFYSFQDISFNIIQKLSRLSRNFPSKIHKNSVHQDIEQKCDQCNFKTLKFETMRYHIKAKHSETKISSSQCDFSQPVSSKVKSHHRQVHL